MTNPFADPRAPKGYGSQAKALMKVRILEHGSALVDCPYCIILYKKKNPVDVTKFIDGDGKREHVTACNKGHVLRFKTIAEWQENRRKAGIQA